MNFGAKGRIRPKTLSNVTSKSSKGDRKPQPPEETSQRISHYEKKSKPSSASRNRRGSTKSSRSHISSQGDSFEPDEEIAGEQDIKFINIPSLRDKIQSGGEEEIKHSTINRINPEEILAKCQETQFDKVYEIELHADHIVNIEHLEKFPKLRVLDLSCNYIERISNLQVLSDLRELKLYGNRITEVTNLENLKELVTLQLNDNRIKEIGKGLAQQRKLKTLRLDGNIIHKIDVRELAALNQLIFLDLSNNRLENVSPLNCLPKLEELYLVNNRLRTVADLSRCKNLQEVDVSNNRISDLTGLKGLPKLNVLHAAGNQISSLKSIGKLKCLTELSLSGNRLLELRTITDFFPAIQLLDIANNHIESWKEVESLSSLEDLVELYISGNPFCLENGEKPHYFHELQTLLPKIDILDGAHTKHFSAKPGTPLMRPMSANSVLAFRPEYAPLRDAAMVSSRQVEGQLKSLADQLASFESDLSERFASIRASVNTLPAESPLLLSRPSSGIADNRPVSKCSKRSRIKAAQEFAAQIDFNEKV